MTDSPIDPTEEILADLAATGEGDAANSDAYDDVPQGPATSDALEAVLARTQLPANSPAAAAVDRLLKEGRTRRLAGVRRRTLIDALDNELADRRRDAGPIQVVLRSRRYSDGTPLVDLVPRIRDELDRVGAETSGVDVSALQAIENGDADITDTRALQTVAAWSVVCGLPKSAATRAFRDAIAGIAENTPLRAAAGAHPHDASTGPEHPAAAMFIEFLDTLSVVEPEED